MSDTQNKSKSTTKHLKVKTVNIRDKKKILILPPLKTDHPQKNNRHECGEAFTVAVDARRYWRNSLKLEA